MLERLEMRNVGPASAMSLELAPRLNLITGDNGLGKSFLLDVAWWALTRWWPRDLNPRLMSGYMARPRVMGQPAKLCFSVKSASGESKTHEIAYSVSEEVWPTQRGRPLKPGLVIHAHSDGGFSIWDPVRNYWNNQASVSVQDRLRAYVFSSEEVWSGLINPVKGKSTRVCNGLLDDWSGWIRERGENAKRMADVLGMLTILGEPVKVGPLLRLSVNDAQDMPSIDTDFAAAVPIVHASSAVRRITALAYMLVWSWTEHLRAAEQLGKQITRQIVLLFDELDAHLHPRWQRTIVPAILKVMDSVTDGGTELQLIAATHSPLVLASLEPYFEDERDRLFHLDVTDGCVQVHAEPWAKQGDALNWLVSDVFGLGQARSLEAERAIEAAEAFMHDSGSNNPEELRHRHQIDGELQRLLPGHDPFWPRWIVWAEKQDGRI